MRSLRPSSDDRPIDRRSFLLAGGSLAASSIWSSRALGRVRRAVAFSDEPFSLGVASGDPAPDGVVIWTRLAPQPLQGGGMPDEAVEVAWQVADDEGMTRVVREGTTVASPDWAHSVHVEVEGLRPDRWYWYQFKAGGEVSPKGRTRTMPAADAMPEALRFAFASCQHFESGYFTAYEHMAREGLDLVFHLGDYIYEGAASEGHAVRHHIGPEVESLQQYRDRHAQYKCDEALRAMHAAAPWVVTWDDHELSNDCAGPYSQREGVSPDEFLKRRACAYQAYYEHMPLRRASLPHGPDMQLYRRFGFGRLAEFFVLDTRQYRTDQPCGGGKGPQCEGAFDPTATILGAEQRAWLLDGLSASPARWNALAQQVMMARVDADPGEGEAYSMDKWPGYEADRRRLIRHFAEGKVANPVVLGGDIHSHWSNALIADFDDFDSKVVGSEFVGTSISSGGDGSSEPKNLDRLLAENPFVKFHATQRGYVSCRVSPKEWRTDFRVLDYVSRKGAPIETRASFVVEDGRPGPRSV